MKSASNPRYPWRSAIVSVAIWSTVQIVSASTPETNAASSTAPDKVAAPVASDLKVSVSSIAMTTNLSRKGTIATATVTILNSDGRPVVGALVTGMWSGLTSSNGSALTNRKGRATFHSARVTQGGTFRFDLGAVTAMGATYDSTANATTHESIDAAETAAVVASGEE